MNKTKLLSVAVIALLVLNFGILGFLFFSKKHDSNRSKMPREIIIKKLQFDENQIVEYEIIIEEHQKAIRNLDDSIRKTKNELYQLLNEEKINSVQKDSLYLQLANYQKQIETTHFNHFLEIKKLCKKEQSVHFNELTTELGKIFAPNRKPRNE